METLIRSIYAGFMIGIGGIVYLSLENKIVGSLLFSFGLLTIVTRGYNLYTGKVGFIKEVKDIPYMIKIIIGNFIGTYLVASMIQLTNINISAVNICKAKLSMQYEALFIASVFCGAMMYLAVANYFKAKNIIFIVAPVMIFILCGYEHSIANMFYFSLANMWSAETIVRILLMIVGNGIGANAMRIYEV